MTNVRNKLPSRFLRKLGSVNRSSVTTSLDNIPFMNNAENNVITFSKDLYNSSSKLQQDLLTNFEKTIKSTMIKNPITQSDFKYGTLRITQPGYYILTENIVFNPVNLFPSKDQITKYPIGKNGPFHLGFFAAITIECDNVIIDLNGYSIRQSKRHNLLQRFFSCIELANSPFIPKQGPHSFISNFKSANNCLIANGYLEESSHHGIHGNSNSKIAIHNLKITNFEVAGIALNGATNSIISECTILGKNKDIPVVSSFSQALFCARFLEQRIHTNSVVYSKLDKDLQLGYSQIIGNKPQTTYFENKTGKYDGNMYGIVLNVNGVVINNFISTRSNTQGNEDILVFKNRIDRIDSHPVEILALSVNKKNMTNTAYGGKRMVGAFGDVFDIEKVMDENKKYRGNSLSDAQIFLSGLTSNKGTANIAPEIIEWSHSERSLPKTVSYVPEGDSMGHFMKGNIGLFISGGKSINIVDLQIENVVIHGDNVGTSPLLKKLQRYYQGANAYGVLMTASENVKLNNVNVLEVKTYHPNGIAKKIEEIN